MWARVVETVLGVWLLISPFIFRHPDQATSWWANDLICGALVMAFALFSYWRPTHRAHWGVLVVALWLCAFGYLAGTHPNPPALQNYILVGLLLLLFGIIPNQASFPPPSWQPLLEKEREEEMALH